MDLMIQVSGGFWRQLLAAGRSVPVSKPITAKAVTARFRVTGLNAAVRKLGQAMPTVRTAEIMAIKVNQSGQRDFQKIRRTSATQPSTLPQNHIPESNRQF